MDNSTWEPYRFTAPNLPKIQNPTILAFSCYFHDSSACILKNGSIIAAADEERFSRKKHDAGFPDEAIQFCMDFAGVNSVDLVVFYENPSLKWERIQDTLNKRPPSQATHDKITRVWRDIKSKDRIQETFRRRTGLRNPIVFLDHHMCHASSSFFVSGFDRAAVVTVDGVGEKVTTSYGRGIGSRLELEKCINFPNSIGLFYTALTVFLGFKANDHEYKVMGLAPYGLMDRDKNSYYSRLREMVHLSEDGSFSLDMRYFGHDGFESRAYTPVMSDTLQLDPNPRGAPVTHEHKNLAAALQMVTEDAVINLLNHVHEETKEENLCLAGGVALNSVLNGKILSKTGFRNLFVQPSAGDSGTVIGAAKYAQHLVDAGAPAEHMVHSSYGNGFASDEIGKFLADNNISFTEYLSENEMIEGVAGLLNDKYVVGWFQDRMEWGPRALGNRSILASPLYEDMRDILNAKVKHRELFRPFAPVVCVDDAGDFFECDQPIPEPADYMLMVYPVREEKRSAIPAVTHVDGSGRLQTIREAQNPRYYRLIKRFGDLTGVPILVNTSFNIRGEPIVRSPADAYRCMMGTEIDCLVMDRFLIKRAENMKDAWTPAIDD